MEMDSKQFLRRFAVISLLLVGAFISTNVYVDIYGLFLGRKDRKVYVNERTSKYLLAHRYIPENYNGIIIGPSLSANLNPANIRHFRVYNSSIMGANISELHYLIDKIIEEGKLEIAIICLDPYLTKDFGKKSAAIDPKEFYGALGSTNLLRTYIMYLVRENKMLPGRYAPDLINADGWNNFALEMKDLDSKKAIEEKVRLNAFENTAIEPRAYEELREVVNTLRSNNVKIFAYFSPIPRQIYRLGQTEYGKFESRMLELFASDDIILNLNDEKYADITSDHKYYIDHGHLSAEGQEFVITEINNRLEEHLKTKPVPEKPAVSVSNPGTK